MDIFGGGAAPSEADVGASTHEGLLGIAPKEAPKNGARPSQRGIAARLRDHLAGNAEGSTIRLTLGCLLADELGTELRRVGSGKRMTFSF